ncbi:hypothetical protein [Rhizobium halophytocola]|uniref:Uncharacterized protein n=1 Tax=Rhizobium halophytocola TaxID=735519 RepID=A0ABS4DWT3_9HYPH|nr:hypothetical protein [Rhizobium halophytocola]MBP1850135.1 hypothetical protein [Rhizobium halophytocola]
MPLDANEIKTLKRLIPTARKKQMSFAVWLGKSPEDTLLSLSARSGKGKALLQVSRARAKTTRSAFGKVTIEGNTMSLTCEGKPSGGIATGLRAFLKVIDVPMRIELLDEQGRALDDDGEEAADEAKRAEPSNFSIDTPPTDETMARLAARLEKRRKMDATSRSKAEPDAQQQRRRRNLQERHGALVTRAMRLNAFKHESNKIRKLWEQLAAERRQFELLLKRDDKLDDATDMLADIASTTADLMAEIAPIMAFQKELAKVEPILTRARAVYHPDKSLQATFENFQRQDEVLHKAQLDGQYAQAIRQIDIARLSAERLLDRLPAVDHSKERDRQAFAALQEARAKRKIAEEIPVTLPEVFKLWERAFADLQAADKARLDRDWVAMEGAARAAGGILDQIIALRDEADGQNDQLQQYRKVLQVCRIPLKNPAISPEKAKWQAQIRKALTAISDHVEEGRLSFALKEIEAYSRTLKRQAPKIEEQEKAREMRRDDSRAAFSERKTDQAAAGAIKPMTEEGLVLYRKMQDALAAFQKASNGGEEDWEEKLEHYAQAVAAVLAREPVEAAQAKAAKSAFDEKQKRAQQAYGEARVLIKANRPLLDQEEETLQAATAKVSTLKKQSRYGEAQKAAQEVLACAETIIAKKPEVEQRNQVLKDKFFSAERDARPRIDGAMAYDPTVLPTISADHQTLTGLDAQLKGERAEGLWEKATATLREMKAVCERLAPFDAHYVTARARVEDARERFDAGRSAQDRELVKKASGIPGCTQELSKRRWLFDAVSTDYHQAYKQHRYEDAGRTWQELVDAAREVIALEGEYTPLRKKKFGMKTKVDGIVEKSLEILPLTPDLAKLRKALLDSKVRLEAAYAVFDDAAIEACQRTALQAAKALDNAANAKVVKSILGGGETVYRAALKKAKETAANAVKTIEASDGEELRQQSFDTKLQLLKDLQAGKAGLSTAERAAQRKLYAAIEPDPAFTALDETRESALITSIAADEELMAAQESWPGKSIKERLQLLRRTLAAQCKIYGMPMVALEPYEEASNMTAYYADRQHVIRINTHPSGKMDDLFAVIDLVVHENAHNYQLSLKKRLDEGLIEKDSPEYRQAQLFALNVDAGYVEAREDGDVYQKQPREAHSFKLGPRVAEAIKARMNP